MNVGDPFTAEEDLVPWYSGYGMNPHVTIPAGTVGEITAVNVPPVRGRGTYFVVAFELDGVRWQTSFPTKSRKAVTA